MVSRDLCELAKLNSCLKLSLCGKCIHVYLPDESECSVEVGVVAIGGGPLSEGASSHLTTQLNKLC